MIPKMTKGSLRGKEQKAVNVGAATKLFLPEEDIEETYYSTLGEIFSTGKVSNDSFLGSLMQRSLNRLHVDANKDAESAAFVVRNIDRVVKDTAQYYSRKKTMDTDFSRYLLRDRLFPWQREVYDDPSHRITMLAGRRSGKSHNNVRLALKHCLDKDEKPREAIIMGLTLEKTAAIYWDELKRAILDSHINVRKWDNNSYSVELTNGNSITLWGNNSKAEREKLRGKDASMFVIDEMQSQSGLFYLMESVIGPMIKGRNGYIVLSGTAPLSAGTYWEKAIQDDAFSHYHATMEDNPTIPDYQHALEQVLEENHWTRDNITFRREYLGEIAYDTNRMIYPVRKYYEEVPDTFRPTRCYIGVDYGWSDSTSFAPVIADDHGNGYLVDEWKESHVGSSKIVEKMKILTKEIHEKYDIPVESIKIIQDSSHQMIGVDFYNSGVTNLQNAYKFDENSQIARVAEGLELGELLIKKSGYFDQECDQFIWKWNDEKSCVVYQIDEDAFHPDIADSVKYAWNTYLSDLTAA